MRITLQNGTVIRKAAVAGMLFAGDRQEYVLLHPEPVRCDPKFRTVTFLCVSDETIGFDDQLIGEISVNGKYYGVPFHVTLSGTWHISHNIEKPYIYVTVGEEE